MLNIPLKWQSKFPPKVVGDGIPTQVSPTGTAVYRFLIPTEELLKDPQTRSYFDQEDFSGTIARLKDARLVWYPCRQYGPFLPSKILDIEWLSPDLKTLAVHYRTLGSSFRIQSLDSTMKV